MVKDRMAVLLPDGQIGWTDGLVTTERAVCPEQHGGDAAVDPGR